MKIMKNEFILEKKPRIEEWAMWANIAKEEQREELIPVLKYVQEKSGQPDLAKSMAEHLFFEQEARLVVAERLLDICSESGFTAGHTLTRLGYSILESGNCPVPEYGVWKITISDDPLLSHPILDFDKSYEEPTSYQELMSDKNKNKKCSIRRILKYVQENNGKPDLVKKMAEDLFFEQDARLVVAEKSLDICSDLSLTSSDYTLTSLGLSILESESCPSTEYEVLKTTISDDPLLPHSIEGLDKSYKKLSSYAKLIGNKNKKRDIRYIPEWFKKWCDSVSKEEYFITIYQGSKFMVYQIKDRGVKLPVQAEDSLFWNIDKSCVSMRGKNVDIKRRIQVSQVWNELLAQRNLIELWDGDSIASKFAEVKTEARKLMQDDFTFEAPIIEEYGTFSTFVAEGVNIRAASREDAHEWAEWRLCENVSGFACSDLYESWQASAAEPFSKFDISLPRRDELAHKMWQEGRSKKSWYLIAAADWNL